MREEDYWQASPRANFIPGPQVTAGSEQTTPMTDVRAPRHVPILMHHYIRVNPDPKDRLGADLSVRPELFAAQMAWLASHGYHTVTLGQVIAAWQGASLPANPIVVTFDDGYEDVYAEAFATMRRYAFVGVAFVVTGFIGRQGYATVSELREMRDHGWEIGSHSQSHVDLTKLGAAALRYETEGAAIRLDELVGQRPISFAYPAGRFNPWAERAVASAGYSDAVTTQWGIADMQSDRMALPRLRIRGSMDLSSFATLLSSMRP